MEKLQPKNFTIPKIIYPLTVLPTSPDHILRDIEHSINTFMWDGNIAKIKHTILIQTIDNGGSSMPNIRNILHTAKASWVKRLVDDKNKRLVDDKNKRLVDDKNKRLVDDKNKPLVDDKNKRLVDDKNKPLVDDKNKPLVDDKNKRLVDDRNKSSCNSFYNSILNEYGGKLVFERDIDQADVKRMFKNNRNYTILAIFKKTKTQPHLNT